ncbi:MAG: cohesin domain-containing protein, partial [Bacteroidota bacterium]
MDASICNGQFYTFGSQTLTTGGTYTNTVTAANGCDSVVTLNLSVIPTYNVTTQASILFGNSYTLGNQVLTVCGNYSHVFQSVSGCDSTVNLILTVISPNVTIGSATTCAGDTVSIPVQILNGNAIGAISLAINYNNANLAFIGASDINPSVSSSIIVNAGIFNGQSQVRAGWFDINPISLNGLLFNLKFLASASSPLDFDLITPDICEIADENAVAIPGTSFSNGSVTATPLSTSSIDASICDGQSYSFGSQTLTTGGTYTNTLTTANGCDSVVTLNLSVFPTYSVTTQASILFGNSYTLGNQVLTVGGNYSQVFQSVSGCDSTVNLLLTVISPNVTIGNATTCAGDTVSIPVQILNGNAIGAI